MLLMASLPWYDLPPRQPQLDHFWSVLQRQLRSKECNIQLPDCLDRHTPLQQQWANPNLLLSQCCGPDLFTAHAQDLIPIARPIFSDLPCAAGHYFSHIVVPSAQASKRPENNRWVINSPSSRSGGCALFEWAKRQALPCQTVLVSGAHANSLHYLRAGLADIAAIDAHSWPLLDTRGVTIIGSSRPAATPPFVMHQGCPIPLAVMRSALSEAVALAGAQLQISGLMPASRRLYQPEATEPLSQHYSQH